MRSRRHIIRRSVRWSLASVVGLIASLALFANTALANSYATYCIYDHNGDKAPSWAGNNPTGQSPFWYSEVLTGSNSGTNCTNWNGFYCFQTEGIKGNISTAGNPYTWNNTTQHIDVYVTSTENRTMRWAAVGFNIGQFSHCDGTNTYQTGYTVYVDIWDDSSKPCFQQLDGSAPSNASYDSRYYGVSGSYQQYNIYFEVPGSGNIQWLAYADFTDTLTAAAAVGEAYANPPGNGTWPNCPVLGQSWNGEWDVFGQQASQSTFASHLQLYKNGGWVDWTNAADGNVQTIPYTNAPYTYQAISNFNGGDYTEFEVGGGYN